MSKQYNGVPTQSPRLKSQLGQKHFKDNKVVNKDRHVAMLGYEENNSQRRRHSSPNTPNKRVSGNNSSRNTVSSQKNKSVNYKKSRSTSASRIQGNDNRFEYTEGNQKPLKDRWWDDQIRTKKDSNSSIKSNNRGRSRKDEAANDSFEQIRKKDSRVNEFQVSLPKVAIFFSIIIDSKFEISSFKTSIFLNSSHFKTIGSNSKMVHEAWIPISIYQLVDHY